METSMLAFLAAPFVASLILTGIHGIHLIVGIGCIIYLWVRAYRKTLTPDKYVAVEVTSLYWHLVDAIWLFLMPLLYLAGAGMHH